jgi:YD repeat-containing protein
VMLDRAEAGLRGPVRSCALERDYVYPDHHWVMHTGDTFSLAGDLLERRHRNPDGSEWSIVCRYDEHGRILEKEQANQLLSYKYDSLGRLERVMLRPGLEGERLVESVQYGAHGTRTSTSYPPPLSDAEWKTRGVSAESRLHLSLDAVVIMTAFDENDRPVRKVLYNADDRVIRRVAFRYNQRGLLLEEGELIGESIREDFRNVFRYDALGRQIEVDQRWGDGLGGARHTFEYNDHGDIEQETIEQDEGLLNEVRERGPQTWSRRFACQYDDSGNWIKRTTETIQSTGEVRVSMIEQRDLTYY